jgi:glycosyltransferase involved in cell wall biosynthesis
VRRKPLRVVLVIENIAFARDHRLRKQATALVAAGARVTVVCRRDAGNRDVVEGVRVRDYPAPREGSRKIDFVLEYGYSVLMAAWEVLRLFVTEGFDTLQLSSTPDIYYVLAYPYRLLRRRVVFDFKDLSPETYVARYGTTESFFYRLLLVMERASLRAADHVLVVNASLRDIAHDRGGVPLDRITVVGNGPWLERLDRRDPDPQLRHGRARMAVWVGFISPQDHLDLAVRAMEHLVKVIGRTDCSLAIVGVGDARAELELLVASLGIEPYVRFDGWVDPAAVAGYLATADVGLEPGTEDFVSPVKALEFMAAGLPFVAFDVRETKALADGAAVYAERGNFGQMAQLMDDLLADDGVRSTMGEIGRERIRTALAWEHQAERYVRIMQETDDDQGHQTHRGVRR